MTHPNDTKVSQKRSERVSGLFKHDGSPTQPGYYSAYRASGTVKGDIEIEIEFGYERTEPETVNTLYPGDIYCPVCAEVKSKSYVNPMILSQSIRKTS